MYNEHFYVFIDYNQDGTFDETTELVMTGNGAGATTGTVQVPSQALAGSTRMRVIMSYTSLPGFCGWYNYGEVEDYTVNIINSGNIRGGEMPSASLPMVSEWGIIDETNTERGNTFVARLYPNPAQDYINLDLTVSQAGETDLILSNSLGQRILSQQVTTRLGMNTIKVDLPELPTGLYFLSIQTPKGQHQTMSLWIK